MLSDNRTFKVLAYYNAVANGQTSFLSEALVRLGQLKAVQLHSNNSPISSLLCDVDVYVGVWIQIHTMARVASLESKNVYKVCR